VDMASTTDSINENNNAPRLTPRNFRMIAPVPNINALTTTFREMSLNSPRRYNGRRNEALSNDSMSVSSNDSSNYMSVSSNESPNLPSYESIMKPTLPASRINMRGSIAKAPIAKAPIAKAPISRVKSVASAANAVNVPKAVKASNVPITSDMSLDAKAFLLHTDRTHFLLSSDLDIPSLLKNIDIWIRTANAKEGLGEYITNAVAHLVHANIRTIKRANPQIKFKKEHFEQIIILVQNNIENTFDTWEKIKPKKLMKILFGVDEESELQFDKTKGAEKDIRTRDILETLTPTKQCEKALGIQKHPICWLSGFKITECYICEHKLSIKNALEHLNLIQCADTYDTLDPNYKKVLQEEYAHSHSCCNSRKSDHSYIKYKKSTNQYVINQDRIMVDINRIIDTAQIKSLSKCHCSTIKGLKRASPDMMLQNIMEQLETIRSFMNAQVEAIIGIVGKKGRPTMDQFHAYQIYQMFIKFRFLSQIHENNWIKLITNIAINLQAGRKSNENIAVYLKNKQTRKKKNYEENENNVNNESNNENRYTSRRMGGLQRGGTHLTTQSEIMFICILQHIPDDFYNIIDDLDISLDDITYRMNGTHIVFVENGADKRQVMTMNIASIFAMYNELKTELDLKEDGRWIKDREQLNRIYRENRDAVLMDLRSASHSSHSPHSSHSSHSSLSNRVLLNTTLKKSIKSSMNAA